ncbi:MAG: hypothetical protein M1834_007939 [Cirrosporium novae-zelandiae]|nr:MAG: hypothetical protein M1834_007939 [Cirrosporium novae-zelandiae]
MSRDQQQGYSPFPLSYHYITPPNRHSAQHFTVSSNHVPWQRVPDYRFINSQSRSRTVFPPTNTSNSISMPGQASSSMNQPMAGNLRSLHFIVRPGNQFVPLVAVDELPSHINIHGVPRSLSVMEIRGMESVGFAANRGSCYTVSTNYTTGNDTLTTGYTPSPPQPPIGSQGFAPHASEVASTYSSEIASQALVPTTSSSRTNSPKAMTTMAPLPRSDDEEQKQTQMVIDALVNAAGGESNTGSRRMVASSSKAKGVKEFCSYWMRHGECDYAQQGCLYKHEMPTDQATLEGLGFRQLPRWYCELKGIPIAGPKRETTTGRFQRRSDNGDDTHERKPTRAMLPLTSGTPAQAAARRQAAMAPKSTPPPPQPLLRQRTIHPASPRASPRIEEIDEKASEPKSSPMRTSSSFATSSMSVTSTPSDPLSMVPALQPTPAMAPPGETFAELSFLDTPAVDSPLRNLGKRRVPAIRRTGTFIPPANPLDLGTTRVAHPRHFCTEDQEKFAINEVEKK